MEGRGVNEECQELHQRGREVRGAEKGQRSQPKVKDSHTRPEKPKIETDEGRREEKGR